jgi:DNA-binding NtrC family response regulator
MNTNNEERTAAILIIEDEETVRLSLKAILEEEGYEVSDVENGSGAIDLMGKKFYDILIVDYRLPDMTGLDFLKRAVQINKESVPIIVTGCISIEIAVESMRVGTHDYLVKPLNIEELKKTLKNILEEKEEMRKGKEKFQQIVQNLHEIDENGIEVIIDKR